MIEYQHTAPASDSRFDRKCIELTLFELDVRMCGPSDGEHRLGHVHAYDIEATFRHKSRHSAWPAPNIGDANDGLSLDQLDEGHEQRLGRPGLLSLS